ncbi:helix-turn-helix domain-containing protein [Mycoplana sp. MJR14]|uniref:GlxA family transcriptional regulator n=1 Tax=Mycoplana sp. MJR14 TaxID=3032583 RepID=UPI0023DCB315|nr:helix-turn-helix domain-containing protein [Mycoplana sp. MJR14]MDF1635444.1 helix-turn-helix domain-containing protein [Mycoplana sp. MJR14]
MRLAILALEGVFDTGLTVLMDTFSTANELAAAAGAERAPFEVSVIGLQPKIRTGLGLDLTTEPAGSLGKPDWVVVPALNAKQPQLLLAALGREDVREAVAQLRGWHTRGFRIAGACIGTFLLAEAGVLDGREATTTWSLAPLFRQRYPQVRLDDTRMIVALDGVVTAGAAMGHLDLALWLMRQQSPELAATVARFLLIDKRPSQARYMIPDFLAHADPLIEQFERWARAHLAHGFSLRNAADALCVTPRTLQRRTEAVLGKSPLAFFQDLRVERAQHLISIGLDLDRIAGEVGYADTATLRNLLRQRLGRGVRELRAEA